MRMLQSTHFSMSKAQSIQPHPLEVLQQVLRECNMDWIVHCTVRVFCREIDTRPSPYKRTWTSQSSRGYTYTHFCTVQACLFFSPFYSHHREMRSLVSTHEDRGPLLHPRWRPPTVGTKGGNARQTELPVPEQKRHACICALYNSIYHLSLCML